MRLIAVVLGALAGVSSAHAEVVDRAVAEVGDQPILWSELQLRARLRGQREALNEQQQQMLHDTLSQLIDEQLIVQGEPSISAEPEEVERALNEIGKMNQLSREQILAMVQKQEGMSEKEYRAALELQIRVIRAITIHAKRVGAKVTGGEALDRVRKEWLDELRRTSYFAILPSAITAGTPASAEATPERQQAACSAPVVVLNSFAPPAPAVVTAGAVKRFVLQGSSSPALQAALAGDASALDPLQVGAAMRRLWTLGQIAQLEVRAEETAGGRQLVYQVVERSPVRSLYVTGSPADEPPPRDSLKLGAGAPSHPGALKTDAELLRSHYQKRGYVDAAVKPHWLVTGTDVDVCFTVIPGRRVVIKDIAFRGNRVLTAKLLQSALPPAGAPNGRGGVYDKEAMDEALLHINDLCWDRGLINAKQTARIEPLVPDGYRLVVEVNEGTVYTLEPLVFDGAPPALQAQLEAAVAVKPGEVFNRSRLAAARQRMIALLTSKGYRNVEADIASEINEAKSTVKLTAKLTFAPPAP